jgi:16S rRNA (uracil1498-N3)-methyltransferase
MHFYIPNLNSNILLPEQSAHLLVMRVQENKTYKASNLEGKTCQIRITKIDKKSKTISFEQADIPKKAEFVSRSIFQAVPDKVYLDKLCEVLPLTGVTDLFLFYSDFSTVYPLNIERITKLLIRSCEQGEIAYLPKIVLLNKQDLEVELKRHLPIVLDCETTTTSDFTKRPHPTSPAGDEQNNQNKTALIGPEGGWSESEIKYFRSLNLEFGSLGATIYPAWLAGLVWESSKS